MADEKSPHHNSDPLMQNGQHEADTDPAAQKIADLESQLEKAKNDLLYLRADFDTFRRNAIKERSDLAKYGSEKIIVDLLNVLDNFERAMETKITPEQISNYVKGVEMTAKDIKSLLSKFGVSEVSCQGIPFDPSLHEALGSEENADVPPGTIVRVFKKPYKLHDRVIRPAQVIVSKKSE